MPATQFGSLRQHIHKMASGASANGQTDREFMDEFSIRGNQAAFAGLIARHGPMVLRVCRRVLNHEQDAEDAFQAVFLVLAENARSIRKREALAEWLHGVAYRTAMKAKRTAARRQNTVARLGALSPKPIESPTWDDVQTILDEEIQRLPAPYRAAFVICVLEGKSGAETAVELGIKEGTVGSRLTRARQRLQQRLTRRGVKLSVLLAALSVSESAGNAAVHAFMAQVRAGLLVSASGEAGAGLIPAHVAALAAGVSRALFVARLKLVRALIIGVGIAATGGALTQQSLGTRGAEMTAQAPPVQDKAARPKPISKPEADKPNDPQEVITYKGRVLGPDGKPVAGAKLHMTLSWGYPHQPAPSPEYARTGSDGRFTFQVSNVEFGEQSATVAAAATGCGVGWVNVPADGKCDDLTIQMVKDDGPINGQIVDLEGKPVAGATLRLMQINSARGDNLGHWLEAAKDKKAQSLELEHRYFDRYTIAVPLQAATDLAGRFRLDGIGRNRLVHAQLDGPTIASQHLCIVTRPGEAFQVLHFKGQPELRLPDQITTYYGADFRLAVAPTKPVVGVVRDKDTLKPLAGVTIQSNAAGILGWDFVQTTTDALGRYRLTGLPKRDDFSIKAFADDQPYGSAGKKVPDSPGLEAVTVDFELKRGIWIEGKITDKSTGKPLKAPVEYHALADNPHLRDYPGFGTSFRWANRSLGDRGDGAYRVIGIPGPGLIAVYPPKDYYQRAPNRDDEYGAKEPSTNREQGFFSMGKYAAIARIDPANGIDAVQRDLTLDPGWKFTGTVFGPDGKPMAGSGIVYLNSGLSKIPYQLFPDERMKTPEFTAWFNPRQPLDIIFRHSEQGLVAAARPPKVNNSSIDVRLEPGASAAGRLVDGEGKPSAGVHLHVFARPKKVPNWTNYGLSIKTDVEGKFKLTALLPGYEFRLFDNNGAMLLGDGLRSGETLDLGDVRLQKE
jgi:RNA polymerase sigma factor (sigma-70 family)